MLTGNRWNEQFAFRRVEWPTWKEKEDITQITMGGSLDLSSLTELKQTGSLPFEGATLLEDHDLVRIYYSFEDDSGERHEYVMATLRMSITKPIRNASMVSGTIACTSVLDFLSKKKLGLPFTIQAGTNTVQRAKEIVESFGLRVNNPDTSKHSLSADKTFTSDKTYLSVVNELLDAASFSSAYVDSYGVVQMVKYQLPKDRPITWTFESGENSIMYPELVQEIGRADYNVCRLTYETDTETLWAVATNNDPLSPSSLVNRGFESTLQETVSQLDGETQEERIENLMALAKDKLIDNSSELEHTEFDHAWVPIIPNDGVAIDYKSAQTLWRGAITSMKVRLDVSVPCQLSARSFIRNDISITVEGGALG